MYLSKYLMPVECQLGFLQVLQCLPTVQRHASIERLKWLIQVWVWMGAVCCCRRNWIHSGTWYWWSLDNGAWVCQQFLDDKGIYAVPGKLISLTWIQLGTSETCILSMSLIPVRETSPFLFFLFDCIILNPVLMGFMIWVYWI